MTLNFIFRVLELQAWSYVVLGFERRTLYMLLEQAVYLLHSLRIKTTGVHFILTLGPCVKADAYI